MEYNLDYINVHYALLKAFMHYASSKILDISYSIEGPKIIIQVVLLSSEGLPEAFNKRANEYLPDFEIIIKEVFLTKEKFNENRGEWEPKNYGWLENVLFSKAEVL